MSKDILIAVLERAVKTLFQSLGAAILAGGAAGVSGVDWKYALDVAVLAAFLSVISSVVSLPFGNEGPSVTSEEVSEKW